VRDFGVGTGHPVLCFRGEYGRLHQPGAPASELESR
jgi:hypothetical protein